MIQNSAEMVVASGLSNSKRAREQRGISGREEGYEREARREAGRKQQRRGRVLFLLRFACLDLERSRTRSKGRLDKKKPSPCALVALE